MAERVEQEQRKSLKGSIDKAESRRRMANTTISIRKNKRLESVMKRRVTESPVRQTATEGGVTPVSTTTERSQEVIVFRPEMLPGLRQAIMKGSQEEAYEATSQLRKILSIENQPPIQQVIDCGIVPRLVTFLKFAANPKLQFEAAWSLTNIASGTSAQTKTVVEAGAVPVFVAMITSPNDDVQEQSVWALGNISGDCPAFRDQVLAAGIMKPLLSAIETTKNIKMLRNATWTLSNLARGTPEAEYSLVKPMIPTLARLLGCRDNEVLQDACWALSYLSERKRRDTGHLDELIDRGVASRMVELLSNPSQDIQIPALRTVGNIATGNDRQTDAVLLAGCLAPLSEMVKSGRRNVQKEAAWTISNITAGNRNQIQRVIESPAVAVLVNTIFRSDFAVRRECAWALCNAIGGGNKQQIAALVAKPSVIEAICYMLEGTDVKVLLVCLDALSRTLEVGKGLAKGGINPYRLAVEKAQGLDRLEAVQRLDNDDVYEKAANIVETYFADGDEADETDDENNFRPAQLGDKFAFDVNEETVDFDTAW
jgi:hypothetical protein